MVLNHLRDFLRWQNIFFEVHICSFQQAATFKWSFSICFHTQKTVTTTYPSLTEDVRFLKHSSALTFKGLLHNHSVYPGTRGSPASPQRCPRLRMTRERVRGAEKEGEGRDGRTTNTSHASFCLQTSGSLQYLGSAS